MRRKNQEYDEDIYTEEGIQEQLESDEIEDWEAGFMEGYEQDMDENEEEE